MHESKVFTWCEDAGWENGVHGMAATTEAEMCIMRIWSQRYHVRRVLVYDPLTYPHFPHDSC